MNDENERILTVGRNCWRIARARRLALIVDAADYFRHAKSAMLKAQHSIMLIGWDFDTRIKLEPERQTLEGPNQLGEFLSWLPKHREHLNVYVLKWDLGMIQALGRGMTPFFVMDWITDKKLHLRLDHSHPVGAAHHQKIVVIDDALAFCGGIDMTVDRWDTPQHLDDNPLRTKPSGRAYGPWHDATTAVDGDAAEAIADLARERWHRGTGTLLPPAPTKANLWPEELSPTTEHVEVAIARTIPELGDQHEVHEIQSLYLDAIGAANQTVYIETQYLASRKIADAMVRRLKEASGPEIILVLPKTTEGWLEHKAMDGARRKLLHELWKADRNNRLGVYYPVTAGNQPIYVHAKILTVDDKLLRVGSSNLNNRSMGFDTECDLAVEATGQSADQMKLRSTILGVRDNLLCEHLGIEPHIFSAALDVNAGSVLKAIEALRNSGKTLKPFDRATIENDESVLAENDLLDPEKMPKVWSQRIVEKIASVPKIFSSGWIRGSS
ncbi:MAG: phospholipase D-like domain-containing protein [Bradyrhizobium sp.]|nr:phospholipase D-like domain-containing protein [Bradyrhizobium sp.]